ncbi:MAG: dethiobiotin synthase [Solirubrobacteraceae bacterium MAG38_C4-C5]|nr:dethiobiotin synthase [Candidatus Siliceabacter maunaloa]
MSVLVVAGTDTGVGKTVVTAALAALACAEGRRVAVVKPVQTGVAPGEPGDVDEVRRLAGVADVHELARLREPLAPASAARRTGDGRKVPAGGRSAAEAHGLPSVAEVAADVERLAAGRDLVLVEGAGGLLVHLDDAGGTIADVAALLGAPVLVVARAGLGTLNHTALTCEALRARGVACAGVVVGAWPAQPDLAARCNLDDLPAYAGVPLVGRLPEGAGRLAPDAFLAAARGIILSDPVEVPA